MTEASKDTSPKPTNANRIYIAPDTIRWFASRSRSQSELARKLDIHRVTLPDVLERAGLTKDDVKALFIEAGAHYRERMAEQHARGRALRERQEREWKEICDLYVDSMMSIDEVATATGRSIGGVHRILVLNGVDTTRHPERTTGMSTARNSIIRDELNALLADHFHDIPDAQQRAHDATDKIMRTYRVTRVRNPPRETKPPAASRPTYARPRTSPAGSAPTSD